MNGWTRKVSVAALGGALAVLASGCGGDEGGGGGSTSGTDTTCNFGEVFSTDGRIVANELTVLEDDQEFFVPYNAALTLR